MKEDKDYVFAIFGVTFSIEERENCLQTVDHLWKFKSARTSDLNQLKKYVEDLKHWRDETSKFHIEFGGANEKVISEICDWIDTELETVDVPFLQYTSSYTSLLILNWKVDTCFGNLHRSDETFFSCLELVKYLNSYYNIENPNKAPNKIAYGWKFALQKDSKPYFYACIKNYLIKNEVEINTVELRKIVGFLMCENGDE